MKQQFEQASGEHISREYIIFDCVRCPGKLVHKHFSVRQAETGVRVLPTILNLSFDTCFHGKHSHSVLLRTCAR
jgi:hypothetical protein